MGLIEKELVYSVVGAGFEVYNELRFGFREHVYKLALERELLARGHRVAREVNVRVFYKGMELTTDRMDMIVDEKLIVEVKATSDRPKGAASQLLSYLRATNIEVGLLLHFGPKRLDRLRLVASNEFKLFARSSTALGSRSNANHLNSRQSTACPLISCIGGICATPEAWNA